MFYRERVGMTQNDIRIIGITGGIATGKSTVSRFIRESGFKVIDADLAARIVVEKSSPGLANLVDEFGEGILNPDGSLDRKALGNIIFSDDEKRSKVNDILHPHITSWIIGEIKRHAEFFPVIFVDLPLLFEVRKKMKVEGLVFDEVWVVYLDHDSQLSRLVERDGYSTEDALARIWSQMDIEYKKRLADRVIDNRGEIDDTKAQVQALLEKLR